MPQPTDTIPVPSPVPTAFMIFCRFTGAPPSASEIFTAGRQWALHNVEPPMREVVSAYLSPKLMVLLIAERRETPIEILQACAPMLSERQRADIDAATHCITVRAADHLPGPRLGLWAAVAVAMSCAERYGARIALDADTSAPFALNKPFRELHTHMNPRLASFVVCPYSFRENGSAYMTTVGMARFGLPEIQVLDIPPIPINELAATVIGLCQVLTTMIRPGEAGSGEAPAPVPASFETAVTYAYVQTARGRDLNEASPGTGSEARVRLEYGLQLGNPLRLFWTLRPPLDYQGDYGAWLHGLVNTFFKPEDTLHQVVHGDGMEQAHRRAISELLAVKQRYQNGALASRRFGVKHGFVVGDPSDGQHEYMWVFVREWVGNRIVGELVNSPQMRADLKTGQRIELTEADVFDWIVVGPNGPEEGAYTERDSGAPAAEENQWTMEEDGSSEKPPSYVSRRSDPAFRTRVETAGRAVVRAQYEDYAKISLGACCLLWAKPLLAAIAGAVAWKWSPPIAGVLFAVSAWQVWMAAPAQRKMILMLRTWKEVAERGEFAVAMPIMVNTSLRQPGANDAPGLFILAPNDDSDPVMLYDAIAHSLSQTPNAADPDAQAALVRLRDQTFVPRRRTSIPKSWVGGKTVYAVDLGVTRAHLAGGVFQTAFLPCLATPGDHGSVATIPWEVPAKIAES